MAAKIKKKDEVIVISGKNKGAKGEVLKVDSSSNRVFVSGVNLVKRHTKATQNTESGIKEKEGSINLSNVAIVDPKDGKATKIGFKFIDDEKEKGEKRKVRFSRRTGEVLTQDIR